jgi:hypothetical protein
MVFTTFVDGTTALADEVNVNFNNSKAFLGEVRMFALSMTGAITKASLQTAGWAICDGTTPATQGISSPTIETTPNLEHTFIRMSDDDSSGGTGGSDTHNHQYQTDSSGGDYVIDTVEGGTTHATYNSAGNEIDVPDLYLGDAYTNNADSKPSYYEVAYFMKVKIV